MDQDEESGVLPAYVLQMVLVFFGAFVIVILCTLFISILRDICSYCSLRYQLERENRRVNVLVVPSKTRTAVVIQNPNHISLGYISNEQV